MTFGRRLDKSRIREDVKRRLRTERNAVQHGVRGLDFRARHRPFAGHDQSPGGNARDADELLHFGNPAASKVKLGTGDARKACIGHAVILSAITRGEERAVARVLKRMELRHVRRAQVRAPHEAMSVRPSRQTVRAHVAMCHRTVAKTVEELDDEPVRTGLQRECLGNHRPRRRPTGDGRRRTETHREI